MGTQLWTWWCWLFFYTHAVHYQAKHSMQYQLLSLLSAMNLISWFYGHGCIISAGPGLSLPGQQAWADHSTSSQSKHPCKATQLCPTHVSITFKLGSNDSTFLLTRNRGRILKQDLTDGRRSTNHGSPAPNAANQKPHWAVMCLKFSSTVRSNQFSH